MVGSTMPAANASGVAAAGDEIESKWASLGGSRSVLGNPISDESNTPDGNGKYRHFQHGSIYWTPSTGAHEVHGFIGQKWAIMGFERSALGYPITDESGTPDGVGRFNHFQQGSIYWTPQTGAHEVQGAIRVKWSSIGYERSNIGYPVTDETKTPDGVGRFNHFQNGSIYWTPQLGAHVIFGAIRDKWASLGYERGSLGYPISDIQFTPAGEVCLFQHGSLTYSGMVPPQVDVHLTTIHVTLKTNQPTASTNQPAASTNQPAAPKGHITYSVQKGPGIPAVTVRNPITGQDVQISPAQDGVTIGWTVELDHQAVQTLLSSRDDFLQLAAIYELPPHVSGLILLFLVAIKVADTTNGNGAKIVYIFVTNGTFVTPR
jgi:uncharacterized protein with LGFP repeats